MTASLLLQPVDRRTPVPPVAEPCCAAGLLAVSPRLALLALPAPPGIERLAGTMPGSLAGGLQPPLSWHSLLLPQGQTHLLLARAQPGLAPGGTIRLQAPSGQILHLGLEPAGSAAALLGTAEPGVLLQVLRFVAGKAISLFRAAEDADLAATCLGLAAAARGVARPGVAAARCGRDAMLWSLPAGTAAGPCILLTRQRLQRVMLGGDHAILPDAGPEESWLLTTGGDALIHLPAGPRRPALGALARGKDPAGRALYGKALAELVRRSATEAPMRRLLRDQQILMPTARFRQVAAPEHPFGASLDLAVPDHAGGVFLRGWLRDPLGLVAGLDLAGPYGSLPLDPGALLRFRRPDLVKEYAGAPHGGADGRAGFVLHLAGAAPHPVAQWRLRLRLGTGEQVTLVAPPGPPQAQAARDAILAAVAPPHATPELMAKAIAPPVERLQAIVMAGRTVPEVIRMGDANRAPAASLIVPLYRNLRFLRHQFGAFARDPALRETELIYVLDSPEQRDEVEHMLRGLHRLYRLPLVLVVQPRNYGYGAACQAGAAEARAPVLLLLNSDVVPAARGWLAPMLSALKRQRRLAAVGPKLLFEDGSLQHAGLYFLRMPGEAEWYNDHYFKGHPRHWPAAQCARRVPGVTGAALCVRAEAWRAVGGISTDYVIGDYEDSDLCLRLRADGREIGYVPQSELFHFERQSIRDHGGYAKGLASTYNRGLQHRRWAEEIAALMARQARAGHA